MTTADFLAACFWPLVILFAVLLKTVRDPMLLRWIGAIIGSFIALCVILWVAYGPSSLVGVVDFYLFLFIVGLGLIWAGLQEWRFLSAGFEIDMEGLRSHPRWCRACGPDGHDPDSGLLPVTDRA